MKKASELFTHRITIMVGHYGSGKTELSINTALELRSVHSEVTLVDLDIVNPYFRSAEQSELLERGGVHTIAPTFATTTVDIPALPAVIQSVFNRRQARVVFDVGGDDTGAVALGRYKPYFDADDREMLFVVNTFRPFSSTPEDIADLYGRICSRARMEASAIIANPNFGAATTPDDVLRGWDVLLAASARLGLPIRALAVTESILPALPGELAERAYLVTPRMRPDWFTL